LVKWGAKKIEISRANEGISMRRGKDEKHFK
jgi:hypothetical protein